MKKIITILFSAAIISSSFAQADNRNWNDRNSNSDYYGNSNDRHFNDQQNNIINQRDQEIKKVNYQNSFQVQQVVNDDDLGIWEKRDILNNLESQRIQRINNIYLQYSNQIAYHQRNNSNDRRNFQEDDDDEEER